MKPHHLANFTCRGEALGTNCTRKSLEVEELGGWLVLTVLLQVFSEHLTGVYECQDLWDRRGAGQEGSPSHLQQGRQGSSQGLDLESQLHPTFSVSHWERLPLFGPQCARLKNGSNDDPCSSCPKEWRASQ